MVGGIVDDGGAFLDGRLRRRGGAGIARAEQRVEAGRRVAVVVRGGGEDVKRGGVMVRDMVGVLRLAGGRRENRMPGEAVVRMRIAAGVSARVRMRVVAMAAGRVRLRAERGGVSRQMDFAVAGVRGGLRGAGAVIVRMRIMSGDRGAAMLCVVAAVIAAKRRRQARDECVVEKGVRPVSRQGVAFMQRMIAADSDGAAGRAERCEREYVVETVGADFGDDQAGVAVVGRGVGRGDHRRNSAGAENALALQPAAGARPETKDGNRKSRGKIRERAAPIHIHKTSLLTSHEQPARALKSPGPS